ncbi:MAG: hypothetical protein EXR52_02585 [Dehalococcoidia bacterium]|nr:hypothetical protein [Dehalococcoidia bacterium]
MAERQQYAGSVSEKDLHVVAAAVTSRAPFLLTLDRPLLRQVNAIGLSLLALTLGDFIKHQLPLHVDYPSLGH